MEKYILLNKNISKGVLTFTFATPKDSVHEKGLCQEMDVMRASIPFLQQSLKGEGVNNADFKIEWLFHKDGSFDWMECPLLVTPEMISWLNSLY